MTKYFKDIPVISYEGKDSKNPLAFKYYNPKEKLGSQTMEEHLRFSMSYWHTLTGAGTDPFGAGTMIREWDHFADPMDKAKARVEAAFELLKKLNIPFFCFHDRDIAPEGSTLRQKNKNLDIIVEYIKQFMNDTDIQLLWGTANAFGHPRYVHGAATSCNADVFAYVAAQVKKAIEITYEWWKIMCFGRREGYKLS